MNYLYRILAEFVTTRILFLSLHVLSSYSYALPQTTHFLLLSANNLILQHKEIFLFTLIC